MVDLASPQTATASSRLYALRQFDKATYRKEVDGLCSNVVRRFRRLLRLHDFVHWAFFGLLTAEAATLVVVFPFLVYSSLLAVGIAALLFTAFVYASMRLYLQTRKPEQLHHLCTSFLFSCRELLHYQEGWSDHQLALASGATRLASQLKGQEYLLYQPPRILSAISPYLERLSCLCHWRDVLRLRELLLQAAVEEQIKLVQREPTQLEVHATLANAYVNLSSLYLDPRSATDYDEEQWIPPGRYGEQMQGHYHAAASRAVEELKILSAYAPDDPWVHAQLAYSYRDLQMPDEEIGEYEAILRLRPEDQDTLFKLGMRYFQQGHNAKGLHVYEVLKRRRHKKADELLHFYGSFTAQTPSNRLFQ